MLSAAARSYAGATLMRVLQVMASGARGGGADHLCGLLPALRDLGVENIAAVGDDGPLLSQLRALGFNTHPLPHMMQKRSDYGQARLLRRLIQQHQVDIIHCHGTRAAFYGALARVGVRHLAPQIYTVHGTSFRKETKLLRRGVFLASEALAARLSAHVISVSKRDMDEMCTRHLVSPKHISHIANAVNPTRFFAGDKQAMRQKLSLPLNAFLMGTVARLVPQKSVADLIHALATCAHGIVVIVGDGEQRESLADLARSYPGRVLFLGERGDVPEILQALDVFVLSSRWEGEPIALLEAMASALPCIATATEGAQEIIRDGTNGILCPIGDSAALGRALNRLQADEPLRARLAHNARASMMNRTHAAQARQVMEIYARYFNRSVMHKPATVITSLSCK